MDKKTLTIILAVVLIAGFFLPYLSSGPFSTAGISGFDFIKGGGGKADKYILLLSPIAGLLLLVGAANNGNYTPSRGVLVLLALAGVLYLVIRSLIEGADIGQLFKMLGLGYWLSLAAALVLALYNPKKA
jgi:hypothetical protein